MKFKYQARNKQGELQVGFVEAPSRDGAISVLTSHDLFVLSIEEQEKRGIRQELFRFLNRVKVKDLMIFTRQLATLIESQLPLDNALRTLYQQTTNLILKEATFQIVQDVNQVWRFRKHLKDKNQYFLIFM